MSCRVVPLVVCAAALAGSACLPSVTDAENGGFPPDTLPLAVSDSTISFSMDRSVLYVGEQMQLFFTVRNNGSATRVIQGSSGCTLNVKVFTLSGAVVSPVSSPICTADVVTFATLLPGEVITMMRSFIPTNQGSPPVVLPAGVYDLEPTVNAIGFVRTGRRLRIQIVK